MAAPEQLLQQVKDLNKKSDYQQVIDLLPDYELDEHKDADLYAEAAQAYYRLHKIEPCKRLAEKSLSLHPKLAKA